MTRPIDDGRWDRWCPTCQAPPDVVCHTASGRPKNEPHAARTRAPTPIRSRRTTIAASRRFSQEVKRRAAGWCEIRTPDCPPGRHRGHHAHHLERRGQGGKHDPENGIWVCWSAHDWIHAHPAKAREQLWLKGSTALRRQSGIVEGDHPRR